MNSSAQGPLRYKEVAQDLEVLGSKLEGLFKEILHHNDLTVHAVTSRVKTEQSASRKVESAPEKYAAGYDDLTDILGIRVITYFADQVDQVASVLGKELAVDDENSVDKRLVHAHNQFGYMSFHYIASVSKSRALLIEYQRFGGVKFEVQIRSILQHAWAEIEHDLGYKGSAGIPKKFKRRFSMLAGVLEMVDKEFASLREDITEDKKEAAEKAQSNPDVLEINQDTLVAMMEVDSELARLDAALADKTGYRLRQLVHKGYLTTRGDTLLRLGVGDMGQLRELINNRMRHIPRLVELWFARPNAPERKRSELPMGVGLLYLGLSIKAERDANLSIARYWKEVIDELGPVPLVPVPQEDVEEGNS